MSAHTPGPWKRDKYGHIVDTSGFDVLFRSLSILAASHSDERMAEAERNTDMAAAAPELLASLKVMFDYVQFSKPVTFADIDAAEAVIAKATGSAS